MTLFQHFYYFQYNLNICELFHCTKMWTVEWEKLFLFVLNIFNEAECLVCNQKLKRISAYSFKRHYESCHLELSSLSEEDRESLIKKLKKDLEIKNNRALNTCKININTTTSSQMKATTISNTMNTLVNGDDLDLINLLEEWNLIQHYDYFIEQKINLDVLCILKPSHVDKLFQNLPIGDQAWFEYKLEIWKQNRFFSYKTPTHKTTTTREFKDKPNNSQRPEEKDFRTTAVIVPQLSVVPSTQFLSSVARKNLDHVKPTSSHSSTPTAIHNEPTQATLTTPAVAKQSGMALMPVRYNLRTILEDTSGGQMIMNYYEKHKILREEHRTALINVIGHYIDASGGILSLSESNQLERQIVELFPTEKEEFYRTNKRGRIYNKVANMKRVYKRFSMPPEELTAPSMENSSTSANSAPSSPIELIKEEDNDEYDGYSIAEFRSLVHTPEKYLEFWKNTQKIRLKHIENIESLSQVLEKWPEYKQHNAVTYINMDFKAKYPDSTSLLDIFHQNKTKLEKLLYSKVAVCSAGYKYLQQYQKCSAESQNLLILWMMHQLFPPNQKVVVDEMGNKRKKRYSIQCSQNTFICIRSSLNSLETALETQLSCGTPPMILVVGELAGEIDQIYVYFEGVRFPMDSVVSAAQLVCELFFLFDLDYPDEAVLFYYFVQTFFLNIESEMKNTKIYTVINEINAYWN